MELDGLPRMADFAAWATAAEGTLGWEPGTFMEAYAGNRAAANEAALEADPVATAVMRLLNWGVVKVDWRGTAQELLEELNRCVPNEDTKRSKAWPKAANALSRRMRRLAPQLREAGIEYSEDEAGHEKKKVKTLKVVERDDRGEERFSNGRAEDARNDGEDGEGDDNSDSEQVEDE